MLKSLVFLHNKVFSFLAWLSCSTRTWWKHTPVLVNSKEVKPVILVFFRAKHGDLVVDKHPVQALIWNRAWEKRRKTGIETDHNSLLYGQFRAKSKDSTYSPRPYRASLVLPFCMRTGLISIFSTEWEWPKWFIRPEALSRSNAHKPSAWKEKWKE